MAKNDIEFWQLKALNKEKRRKKRKRPEMKVTGKKVFELKKIIGKKRK